MTAMQVLLSQQVALVKLTICPDHTSLGLEEFNTSDNILDFLIAQVSDANVFGDLPASGYWVVGEMGIGNDKYARACSPARVNL